MNLLINFPINFTDLVTLNLFSPKDPNALSILIPVLGYSLAFLSGTLMGLMGAGGAILAVPIFVYIFRIPATDATTLSLVVVSLASFAGFLTYAKRKQYSPGSTLQFGIPLLASMFVTRQFGVPRLPNEFFGISLDTFILIGFAGLMLLAAYLIFFPVPATPKRHRNRLSILISWGQSAVQGIVVGGLSGLLGAGGGFMIVPALVRFQGLPFRMATGTSLLLICLNSTTGWGIDFFRSKSFHPEILVPYTAIMLIGTFFGARYSQKIPTDTLRKGFGFLVIFVAVFILIERIFLR